MKTIKEYLQEIKDPVAREAALANLDECTANEEKESMFHALLYGFHWLSTPQGYDYWNDVMWSECGARLED